MGLKPGPLDQQASAKSTELPGAPPYRSIRDAQAVLITSLSHMHLSGYVKDLLCKCTMLTAMMHRLTRVLFGHTFKKITVSGKPNQSQKCCEVRDVSNAQADLSLRHSHVL